MSIKRLRRYLRKLLGRETARDKLKAEVARWRHDNGDKNLRLSYAMDTNSLVWDIGGYEGDFANDIYQKYGCCVHVFEPLEEYYQLCIKRFRGNQQITVFNFGLSDKQGFFNITNDRNASSFITASSVGDTKKAELRSIVDVFNQSGIEKIDLLKINIEGGEFDVLPALIDSGIIRRINNLQIQFHNFVPDAVDRRNRIRDQLALTHREMWNYEFVWESWEIKK